MIIKQTAKDSHGNPLPNTTITYNSANLAYANISYTTDANGCFNLDPASFNGDTHWTPDHIIASGVISND